jgi:hypothetical protein
MTDNEELINAIKKTKYARFILKKSNLAIQQPRIQSTEPENIKEELNKKYTEVKSKYKDTSLDSISRQRSRKIYI